ncbi:MAG TPA: MerR family transcriptional regulator [Steroidobacteraceae bacterium]|nr:MerR family transcriptional regulator [Steroidobacteraceae bacterium]
MRKKKTSNDQPSIGVAECVRRTGLTARALRVYERRGLIRPSRAPNGWRVYGHADLIRLNAIVALKGLGLTLGQIREVLTGSPPALRNVLYMQLAVWQKRRAATDEGAALVRAALANLDIRRDLPIDDLCKLARKMEMTHLREATREAINETVSAEEERAWLTWWSRRPAEETEQMQQYALSQRSVLAELARLSAEGASPTSPEAQALAQRWSGNLTRYNVRSRLLDALAWNATVTRKWLRVGERITARTAAGQWKDPCRNIWQFLHAALKASPLGRASAALLAEAQELATGGAAARASEAASLASRFDELARRYELGDPVVYARWCRAMGSLSDTGEWVDLAPTERAAWDYLIGIADARAG